MCLLLGWAHDISRMFTKLAGYLTAQLETEVVDWQTTLL
jgi:hypothetical protein